MIKKYFFILCAIAFNNAFSQAPGDTLFSTLFHDVKITFPVSTWYDTLTANYTYSNNNDTNIYYPCSVIIDGDTLTNVGARFKGNSSYGHPNQKKSIKLSFDEFVSNQVYDDLKQINLNNSYNDPTFLREKIYLDFCKAKALDAPRCVYTNVSINGALWGFYTIIEEIDKTFLKTHFGNKGGNLFKGDPSGHLKWLGSNPGSYYNNYELKTNETANDWNDLVNFINKINNTPSNQWIDSVDTYFNLYPYLRHYAATILFATLDSYTGSGHNFYLYHNTSTNKFEFIEWDVNGSFGRHHPSGQGLTNEALLDPLWVPTPTGSRPLHEKILQQAALKQQYISNVCDFLYTYFDTLSMNHRIDSLANLVRPYVYADPRKQFTNNDFENNLHSDFGTSTPGLKKFVRERNSYLNTALAPYNCSLTNIQENNLQKNILIWPNPSSGELFITSNQEIKNGTIKIINALGQLIYNETIEQFSKKQILIPEQSAGVYFIFISDGETIISKKFIIQ